MVRIRRSLILLASAHDGRLQIIQGAARGGHADLLFEFMGTDETTLISAFSRSFALEDAAVGGHTHILEALREDGSTVTANRPNRFSSPIPLSTSPPFDLPRPDLTFSGHLPPRISGFCGAAAGLEVAVLPLRGAHQPRGSSQALHERRDL